MFDHVKKKGYQLDMATILRNIMSNDNFKKWIKIMHKIGWKNHSFQSAYVYMPVNCCGVTTNTQFYDKKAKDSKCYHVHIRTVLTNKILKERWRTYLSQETHNVVLESINQMETMKYWEQQKWNIAAAKAKIPQKHIIGNTWFTNVAVVGERL